MNGPGTRRRLAGARMLKLVVPARTAGAARTAASRLPAVTAAMTGMVLLVGGAASVAPGSARGSATHLAEATRPAEATHPAGPAKVNFAIPAPSNPHFYDVSCAAKDSCMAVGSSGPTSDKYLAEQWDGTAWTQLPVPQAQALDGFDAVSCPTKSECMAMDSLGGPPELWNGRSWRAEPLASPLESLGNNPVSCGSATSCVAVGVTPHAAVWDGTAWHASQTVSPPSDFPNDSVLTSVSCASGTDCVAVGGYVTPVPNMPGMFQTSPLAESWDGKTWTQPDTSVVPAGAGLSSVSCLGPADCVAVGKGNTIQELPFGVAAAWNGTTWTALPDPKASLTNVSCTSASSCVALGTGLDPPSPPVAESWNGSTWTQLALPHPLPYESTLNALSCGGPSSCMTVGVAAVPGSLAMTWNGAEWQITRASKLDMLAGVSCAAVGRCVATGGFVGASDAPVTLAEALAGTSWRVTKLTGDTTGRLADVACTGTHGCVAVGDRGLNLSGSLADRWNGRIWRQLPGPTGGGLGAVSCASQTACLATQATLAHWWNGSRWRQVNVPVPSFFTDGGLTDVSCSSASRCLASGSYFSSPCCAAIGHRVPVPPNDLAFADLWNGRGLRLLKPSGSGLGSASCVTASFCMTVGLNTAKLWNGRSWRDFMLPGFFGSPGLVAVSCASTAGCLAVGDYVANRVEHAVAVFWNGARWRRVVIPMPRVYLADVSCASATWCVAVGHSYQGQAATQALAMLWNGTRWRILKTASP